jgi:hypothetical protein
MPKNPMPHEEAELEDGEVEGGETEEIIFRPEMLVPADGVPFFYSNITQVLITPWDVSYRFALLDEAAGKTVARVQAMVTHSPPQAKAFLRLLQRQIDAYEERFGTVQAVADAMLRKEAD